MLVPGMVWHGNRNLNFDRQIMRNGHILAIDQGTTSSRAIIFDTSGGIISMAQKEFPQHYPKPGWVEHDPIDIWSSQSTVTAEAVSKASLDSDDIAAPTSAGPPSTALPTSPPT